MGLDLFAARIKELRSDMKKTQLQFSQLIGITTATLSGYENDFKKPSISVLTDIAEKCNVSTDWLCGLSDKRNNNDEIITYADAIRLVKKLCDADFFFGEWKISYHISEIDDLSRGGYDYASIYCSDAKIIEFFKDWIQMKELCDKGTIPQHLYNLWIEDKLKEYDIPIKPYSDESPFDVSEEDR